MIKVYFYLFLTNIFGISFSLKLMENGEILTSKLYKTIKLPSTKMLIDEQKHEKKDS